MYAKGRGLKRAWRKFLRWCGLDKSNYASERQYAKENPPAESRTVAIHPEPVGFDHPALWGQPMSPVIPELSHLTTQDRTHRSRLSIYYAYGAETEQEMSRGSTPLLNDHVMFRERSLSESMQRSSDLEDSDDDVPVARYLPRSHKLIMTHSRKHLRIVPKSSPMSPLNGCDTAPANQRIRTPAPFQMPVRTEVGSSIADFANESSLRRSSSPYLTVQQQDETDTCNLSAS